MPDDDDDRTRAEFEAFTAGPAWRALPLKIRLLIFRLWRTERDTSPEDGSDPKG
jgi:hypothetical protein